jgi:hypothetical protein
MNDLIHPVVAVVDVGSAAKSGWWRRGADGAETSGRDIDLLVEQLAEDLQADHFVALGFEAPMWIPKPSSAAKIGKGRVREGNRARSASAGSSVLAYGIQQSTYVLWKLANLAPRVTFRPDDLRGRRAQLLVWEAFVSGKAKDRHATEPHIADAMAAGMAFCDRWEAGDVYSDLDAEEKVISLAGLSVHAAGISDDPLLLSIPTVVVKAAELT